MASFNQQQYLLIFTVLGGKLQAEMQQIDMNTDGKHQLIETLVKGLAGLSRGSPTRTIKVQSAVPQAGFEFDPVPNIVQLIPAELQIWGPGTPPSQSNGQVWILSSDLSQGVNKQASLSFNCVGPAALFQ